MRKKNILIIGGSSGIGAEIVNLLSDSAQLFVGSRSLPNESIIKSTTYFEFDITKDQTLPGHLPEILDGLVYCPGTINLRPFPRLKDEDFMEDMTINFLGAVRIIRAALPYLNKSEHIASIVLFSTVAVQTGMAFHTSISSAKGAVEGLTRSLAAEFAP